MAEQTQEQRDAFEWLKEKFNIIFYRYCTQLRMGVPTKMFVADTPDNKLLLKEYGRYLEQRAEFEGWEYKSENFQVIYSNEIPVEGRVVLYNPEDENLGFREVDSKTGLLQRLTQKEADKLRDIMQRETQ